MRDKSIYIILHSFPFVFIYIPNYLKKNSGVCNDEVRNCYTFFEEPEKDWARILECHRKEPPEPSLFE